jgi:hypothetical protein
MHAYHAGAQPEVRTRNREALYGLSKQLQKAAKKVASSPAAAHGTAQRIAQPKQSVAIQPADAAAARITAAGAAPVTPAAKLAAKKALSRLARTSVAADPAAEADDLAQAVSSEDVAVSPEGDVAAATPATPNTAKKAKRKRQRIGSQPALTAPAVNGSAVLAGGGAEAGAKVHRTRSATGASAAAPPGNDATPGEQSNAWNDHRACAPHRMTSPGMKILVAVSLWFHATLLGLQAGLQSMARGRPLPAALQMATLAPPQSARMCTSG